MNFSTCSCVIVSVILSFMGIPVIPSHSGVRNNPLETLTNYLTMRTITGCEGRDHWYHCQFIYLWLVSWHQSRALIGWLWQANHWSLILGDLVNMTCDSENKVRPPSLIMYLFQFWTTKVTLLTPRVYDELRNFTNPVGLMADSDQRSTNHKHNASLFVTRVIK